LILVINFPFVIYYDYADLSFVEIITVAVKLGARSSALVSAARPGGASRNQLRCAVAGVKITDMLKLVAPLIAAISVEKAFS
jgi:hypothetical protein